MIKSTNTVEMFKLEPSDVPNDHDLYPSDDATPLVVEESRTSSGQVVVILPGGDRYEVGSKDLIAAITNAVNRGEGPW